MSKWSQMHASVSISVSITLRIYYIGSSTVDNTRIYWTAHQMWQDHLKLLPLYHSLPRLANHSICLHGRDSRLPSTCIQQKHWRCLKVELRRSWKTISLSVLIFIDLPDRLRRADSTLSINFPTWSPWSTTRTCGTGACSAASTLPPAPIRQRHAQDQALDIDFSCARFRMANEVPTLCGRQHLYQVCSGFVTLMQR